ncbi:MAG: Pr6Pr family membrane protein [Candidatus Heimdallarchaeota archaeon]|nr:Pr6Pr family membrane protein [Candidatus Heimdallarchaeota archaeon]
MKIIDKARQDRIFASKLIIITLSIISQLISLILGITNPDHIGTIMMFNHFKYYTIQSNLLVLSWLIADVIWRDNPEKQHLLDRFQGPITSIITITFLVYTIVLSGIYEPEGLAIYTNTMDHYLIPIYFITLYFVKIPPAYSYKQVVTWWTYPIIYLVFALVHGTITWNYLYPFLDLRKQGTGLTVIWIIGLLALFSFINYLYILKSRKS